MKLEIEFHDSTIESVKRNGSDVEVKLDAVLIVTDPIKGWLEEEDHRVPAVIRVYGVSAAQIPKAEDLFGGDIRGVAGKTFKGVVPVDLKHSGKVELWLSSKAGEFSVTGNGIDVVIDRSMIPKHLLT